MQPSFFKVLSNMDFTKLLRLPPAFLTKHELRGYVKMSSPHSGKQWKVKVEQMEEENGLHCFTDGWPKFAEDAALQLGEFLVFFPVEKSEFNVVIYETSFCQREIPPPPTPSLVNWKANGSNVEREKTRVGTSRGEFGSEESNPLYFETCLKWHQRSRICLPKKFRNAANLKEVKLEFLPSHHCQSVSMDYRRKYHIFELANGWREFRQASGLVYGKTYSFEFNPDENVILVKEVK